MGDTSSQKRQRYFFAAISGGMLLKVSCSRVSVWEVKATEALMSAVLSIWARKPVMKAPLGAKLSSICLKMVSSGIRPMKYGSVWPPSVPFTKDAAVHTMLSKPSTTRP